MKVLHISTADLRHGAGIAAYRLHCGLRKKGIESKMIVAEKTSNDDDVVSLDANSKSTTTSIFRFFKNITELTLNTFWIQNKFSFFSNSLFSHPLIKEASIIHCHNLHWPFKNFPLKTIELGKSKPLVWTFHDMWPLTGHCYHSFNCNKWKSGCGKGCQLSTFIPLAWNSSHKQWLFKKSFYDKNPFQIITPSQWLANIAKETPLLKNHFVHHIPNIIDADLFTPSNKKELRNLYGFSEKDKIIFFSAGNINVPLKGLNLLLDILKNITFNSNIKLILAGNGHIPIRYNKNIRIRHFGKIKNAKKMCELYNLADITVVPSKAETFGNVVAESMACETPVVAFKVGGIPDIIDHKINGYLSEPEDKQSFLEGIEYFLFNDNIRFLAGKRAREKILQFFCEEKITSQHILLYKDMIKKRQE
ncbi:MAG TPA: glycosyltransferase [Candidatus Omnitrophota bacterium]|nr:glycosyltransferase [Candidatus Omnitrophota bacterium]